MQCELRSGDDSWRCRNMSRFKTIVLYLKILVKNSSKGWNIIKEKLTLSLDLWSLTASDFNFVLIQDSGLNIQRIINSPHVDLSYFILKLFPFLSFIKTGDVYKHPRTFSGLSPILRQLLWSLKGIIFIRTFLLVPIKGLCLKVFLVYSLLVV